MKFEFFKMKTLWMLLLTLLAVPVLAQERSVSGTVTDASTREPLIGVTILVEGTYTGTTTDFDGKYTIKVPSGKNLVFSFIGYQSLTANPASATLNVSLEPETKGLEEVVVVGYGTVKKKDATGSVSVVGSKDFNKGAITSPQELMMGKSAGTVITAKSGRPGDSGAIRIRGGSSMSASNHPLIVIDGVPGGDLAMVNPNDIETFTILKDASSTAIYGSRASNGVILITTKNGVKGSKMHLSYNGNMSYNTIPEYLDVMDAAEYTTLVKQLAKEGAVGINNDALKHLGTSSTNWQKEIFRNSVMHDHNLSLSGSTKAMPYRISLGYTNEDGILRTSNMSRTTGAINLNPSLFNDHLKFNINLKGLITDYRYADEGAIGAATAYDPTQPVYNNNTRFGGYHTWVGSDQTLPDGSLNPNGNPNYIATANPMALLYQTDNKSQLQRSLGNIQMDYKFHFLPALRLNVNAGYDIASTEGHNNAPENAAFTFRDGKGRKAEYTNESTMKLFESYLNYNKDIKSIDSRIDATAGYSWQYFKYNGKYHQTNGDGSIESSNTSYANENYLVSFFGRLNYTLKDRYLLTLTLRDDGSSRFDKDSRWGLFPAAAFAWKINEESFLKESKTLSDLKLRLGYGITGQENIGSPYPYMPVYTLSEVTAQYMFGNTYYNTVRPEPYDAKIKWEETTTINVGLDFGFWNNRLSGAIDLYDRTTNDMLNYIPVAAGSNFSNFLTTNVGSMNNKGVELSLNIKAIDQKDMSWDISTNFAYNKNEITKLTRVDDPKYTGVDAGGISGGVGNFIQNQQVGYPVNSFFVFQQVYDKETNMPIEGLYVDRTGNGGVITSSNLNKYHYKKPAPDLTMGISSRFAYKNFDMSFAGRMNIGNYVYNNIASNRGTYNSVYNQSGYFSNVPLMVNKSLFYTPQYFSDFYIENASFFKMDNISIGYNFEEDIKARLSLTVQNVFTITKYSGLDPEVYGGIDNNIYPRPRVYTLGVNLTF